MADFLRGDTVGSLLALIATALQNALRILAFADKRGWGPGEFDQMHALEDTLAEAKKDFQSISPLVNGQHYYENDKRGESLEELRALRAKFDSHTQTLKDWLRSGGPISPLQTRDVVDLRRQLHRAQCRAARRIFNAEREVGGSGARCLGAYLVYRRLREQQEKHSQQEQLKQEQQQKEQQQKRRLSRQSPNSSRRPTLQRVPTWKLQQRRMQEREDERYAGREQLSHSRQASYSCQDEGDIELAGLPASTLVSATATATATATPLPGTPVSLDGKSLATATATALGAAAVSAMQDSSLPPYSHASPYDKPRRPSLEDLVPDCNAIGSFERFGDRDIVFVCDYCDGHIVWEDVYRLPTSRVPPADSMTRPTSLSLTTKTSSLPPILPISAPSAASAASANSTLPPVPPKSADGYPQWQATTTAVSNQEKERTIVFAPLAIANHLPPTGGDWEARLWCPYCDDYMYYDTAEGDHTRYAQDEFGFPSLAAFQEHLEWYHTALPLPALPTPSTNCTLM